MALSRKKWNNIIIIASIIMISTLTFLDNKTSIPSDASPLFDNDSPLAQLQLGDLWLHQQNNGHWQCHQQVLNCAQWGEAWSQVKVSAITAPEPITDIKSQPLVIKIDNHPQAQTWQYIAEYGLLASPAGNWYEIPPSLRSDLYPVIDATKN